MTRTFVMAAALLVVATPAAAERMTLYSVAEGDTFLESGRLDGIGDTTLWNAGLETEAGETVGSVAGSCVQIDDAGTHLCEIAIHHRGRGRMHVQGVQLPEPEPSALTIVGGSGDYAGITGTIESTPVEDRARFRYDIDYRLD